MNDLRDSFEASGLTQVQYARLLGVPLGTLRGWLQGRRCPPRTACTLAWLTRWDPVGVALAAHRQFKTGDCMPDEVDNWFDENILNPK